MKREKYDSMSEDARMGLICFLWRKISPQVRTAFFSVLIFGIVSQGTGLFNKLSHHDDIACLFDAGTGVSSGRWMLQVFGWLEGQFYGNVNTSLPLFNGLTAIVCIGIAAGLLVELLKIRNQVYCALLGCIMVSFPFVTALFAYMFTAHAYMIGMLLMVCCAVLICCRTPWWTKIPAIFLGAASVGIYQSFIPVLLSVLVLYDLKLLSGVESLSVRNFLKTAAVQLVCVLGVMTVYFAMNQFFLRKYQVELSAYSGINQMGAMPVSVYLQRIGLAYREFFNPSRNVFQDMYPGTLHTVYRAMLAADGVLAVRLTVTVWKKSRGKALLLLLLFALFPLGCNFIYVMAEDIHGLMVYGQVMQIVLLIWMLDQLEASPSRAKQVISLLASLALAVTGIMYARFDNQCYLKDTFHQQQAISYYTTLITQIKSLEGYRPDLQLYFVNGFHTMDPSIYNINELDFIRLIPYWHNSPEYMHATRQAFVNRWLGFQTNWYDDPDIENLPEVQAMPFYPRDGSVRIVNDAVVVVKFDPDPSV